MALPLYGRPGRWRSLHLGLYRVYASFWHPLYDFRVYHRPSWRFKYSPCLYQAVERQGLEVGGLLGGAYRFPYYGLLCRCVGLVSTICVCQHHGRAAWRPNLCSRVLQGVRCRSYTACHVDGSHLSDLSFCDYPWCSWRYREGVKDYDARLVHPPAYHRGGCLPVA